MFIMIESRVVSKPWGHEVWIADGQRTPYASKKIVFLAGNKTSLQVHEKKFETNYVLEGEGILLLSDKYFNCRLYLNGMMSDGEIQNYLKNLHSFPLKPGTTFDVTPGHLHRVIAITDLIFFETSTCELDDVIRLEDDTHRGHGKIESEHR